MEFFKIWAATIVLACSYGIAHDQITAHVCVEYFTVAHPEVFGTQSATLLALGWGIIATWWVGAVMGGTIACCSQLGSRHRLALSDVIRVGLVLLLVMGACSLVAGIAGYAFASAGLADVPATLADDIPARSHDRFVADWWAHTAAYATGAFGSLVLCVWIVRQRMRPTGAERAAVVITA